MSVSFNVHDSTTRWDFLPCPRQIRWFLCRCFVCGSSPFLFASPLFLVGETQIWPGDLRVVVASGVFSRLFHDLPRYYGTKEFHDVFNLFTRLSF